MFYLFKINEKNSTTSKSGGSHLSYGVEFVNNLPIKGHLQRIELIKNAFRQGINYIDIAPLYGGGRCEILAGMVYIRCLIFDSLSTFLKELKDLKVLDHFRYLLISFNIF